MAWFLVQGVPFEPPAQPPLGIWGPGDPRPTLPIAGWNPGTGAWPTPPPPLGIWGPTDPRPTLPIAGWNPGTGAWPIIPPQVPTPDPDAPGKFKMVAIYPKSDGSGWEAISFSGDIPAPPPPETAEPKPA